MSFVIPALDEADNIVRAITSIQQHSPHDVPHEIVVVDHGSQDETVALASGAGAEVVHCSEDTIAAARNLGVAATSGEVLVFLDADCALTCEWGEHIRRALDDITTFDLCCAGSQVSPPPSERVFLWRYWFRPFVKQESASHLGSAHMICPRESFERVGGFNEELETGEDYDFCARLKLLGGNLLNMPRLRVDHYGFPRTWCEFVRRERWHGSTDMASFSSFRSSRVAMISTTFAVLMITAVVGIALGSVAVGFPALLLSTLIVVVTSRVKLGHVELKAQVMSWVIIPVYFLARASAIVGAPRRPN